MKRVLMVDDDPLVLWLYKDRLSHHGLQMETAGDGLSAINSLRTARPDLVVLDLMMPKFTGVDVLKFIRGQKDLASLPVIVLSNSYMDELGREAAATGVQKALLKISCSPSVLLGVINDLLAGQTTHGDTAHLLAIPKAAPAPANPPATAPAPAPAPKAAAQPAAPAQPQLHEHPEDPAVTAEFHAKARADFLHGAAATRDSIRSLSDVFVNARNAAERDVQLHNFYRKVHFVTATAGLAGCHHLAQMASAFEALLFELMAKPALLSPSVLRTVGVSVDFLCQLLDQATHSAEDKPISTNTLVVDDDALSNRLAVAALRHAHLQAKGTEDPLVALDWLKANHYDLILLDIEMPGMDGFELCKKIKELPGYKKTPVIYVTSHNDFETRAKGALSGGDDLISKPVFPIELAVKAMTHLLKSQSGSTR